MDLLSIVSERPIKESVPACPSCSSTELTSYGSSTTLLGYPSGSPNPNHCWTTMKCDNCHLEFTREEKYDNVWYTNKKNIILKGIPSCFESYVYHCIECGGHVRREYKGLDGNALPSFGPDEKRMEILSTKIEAGKSVKQYRTFYYCEKCHHGGEVVDDYYEGSNKLHMKENSDGE